MKAFNGNTEECRTPMPLMGDKLFEKVQNLSNNFGKQFLSELVSSGWKKRPIFFELLYLKSLYVKHFLDVKHARLMRPRRSSQCSHLTGRTR